MKKILLLSAAVLSILAAVSCAKEEQETVDRVAKTKHRTVLSATLPSPKTALGDLTAGVWPNYWKTDDQIIVNGVTSEYLEAQYDGQDTATFTFDELLTQPYYAAYPVSAVSDYNEGTATVTLPAVQSYVEGSYDPEAFILCGQNSGSALSLDPKVSIIHLSFTGNASICRIKLTGGSGTALSGTFSTDFVDLTPVSASNVVELKASDAIQLPADFFITVPVGLVGALNVAAYDTDGGKMSKNATVKSALTAGQVYSPAALAYTPSYAIEATAEGITSSTAVICWDNCGDAGHCPAYTVSVYSDAGCNDLVASYAVPAGDACWGNEAPRFCISGLAANTTYYVKVANVTKGSESEALPVTTSAFDIVQVSNTPAEAGDVILAEDFSELRWDCDMVSEGVGFFPTSMSYFSNKEVNAFKAVSTSNESVLGSQDNALASSRLAHWAQGTNNNLYIHPGYIKLVGSGKVTHLVTPALNSIPEGLAATIEVAVTASRYYSASSDVYETEKAIVAVQPAGTYGELAAKATNKNLDLTSNIANITLPAERTWNTFKVTLNGVSHGDRLAFGAASDVSGNNARMAISDIKVTIKALNEPGDLVASVKSVSSSTATFSWTHLGENADFDISKPYRIALYSDESCENLVVSHSIPLTEVVENEQVVGHEPNACWSGKTPCFVFGGLAPDTEYWFVATNTEDSKSSAPISATTEAFTVVDATTVTEAAVGDVILAEDFSEIAYSPDEFAGAAGFIPTNHSVTFIPSGENPEGSFVNSESTSDRIGGGWDLGDSRLSRGWGFFGNQSVFFRTGYLRVGGSGGRTHLVTPALSGIPADKVATIEVTVTATKYDSHTEISVFAEKDLTLNSTTSTTSSSYDKYTGASLSDGHPFGISTTKVWETKSVTISNVDAECQLLIGSLDNYIDPSDSKARNRFYISDVVVTITALDDPALVASVKSVSSSTANFTWTHQGASAAEDIAKPYKASLYRDAACSDLVVSHTFAADASYWNDKTPSFVFGGLNPATEYWFKVEDTESGKVSDPVSATTEAFTVVDATTVHDASVGDVILAEDFSEIGAGPDEIARSAGFVPSNSGKLLPFIPSGDDPYGAYQKDIDGYNPFGDRIFGAGWDLGSSRISKGWGFFGGSSCYYGAGYLRLATSSGRAHIVTPALSGIPAGKVAKIEVTVTASKYESSGSDVAVFAEKDLTINSETDLNSKNYKKYDGASLSDGHALGITAVKSWETKSVTINKVESDYHLLIGSLENAKNRCYISDVVVSIVSLKDKGAIDAVMEISDFDTFKDFLTTCEPGKVIQGNVTADIDLTSAQVEEIDALYPIADFDGIINGNNHTISGLTKPLFAEFTGTVSDLTLNSTLNITDAMNNIGILAGYAENATISGCVTNGSVTFSSASAVSGNIFVGGMIGKINSGTITNCVNNAPVTNNSDAADTSNGCITVGGLTAYAKSVAFSKCINNGAVTNSGVAGSSDTNCVVGGLVGWAVGCDLSASGDDKNINYGDITDNSDSKDTAFAGVVAYADGAVSNFSNCRNEGDITFGGSKTYIFFGGIAGAFANESVIDNTYNNGSITASGATMAKSGYMRCGGIIGGWFKSACTEQTITGCTNTGSITFQPAGLGGEAGGGIDSFVGGIAGGGRNDDGECGKALINCKNSGSITMGSTGSTNSGKLYHRYVVGGIIGFTDVNPTGSICIANIRFRSTSGTNRIGGIAGEMMIDSIHDVTYKGTVNSNGASGTNYTGGLVGNVGTGEKTFNNCTVSGTMRGPNSTTTPAGILCSCKGGGTGPTLNITSCKVGSNTRVQAAASGYWITISSDSDITASNMFGSNGSNHSCTAGTNSGNSVVDPDSITL